jgi:chemotaxis protein CheD
MRVTKEIDDILVTYSLGSCIGLTIYDPVARVGGMIHCMLPLSKTDLAKAAKTPCMFVDTGVPALIQAVFDLGGQRKNLIAKVAGGANILDEQGMFKIGERNHTVLRKILWKNDILISGEEVGGNMARTMYLYISDGRTVIKSGGVEHDL